MWPGAHKWKRIPDLLQQHKTRVQRDTRKGYEINNVECLEFCIQTVITTT